MKSFAAREQSSPHLTIFTGIPLWLFALALIVVLVQEGLFGATAFAQNI